MVQWDDDLYLAKLSVSEGPCKSSGDAACMLPPASGMLQSQTRHFPASQAHSSEHAIERLRERLLCMLCAWQAAPGSDFTTGCFPYHDTQSTVFV